MNKKIFVMVLACMLGAIGMTSCIDNKESESVTNIREAKALQLKSLASLYEAQAEAQRLMAQAQVSQAAAEKLLAEANAELISTQAEKQRLENELLALQIAYEKALQYAREEAELAKLRAEIAEYEARIAQAQADLAIAQQRKALAEQQMKENELVFQKYMLQLQLELEQIQATYENEIKTIKDNALRAELYRLSNNYTEALNQVQYYQQRLVNAQNDSIRYTNGLTSNAIALQKTVNDYLKDIAFYQQIIECAKTKIDYLRGEQINTYDLEEQMRTLKIALNAKEQEKNSAQEAANKALTEANKKYNSIDIYSYMNKIPNNHYWYQIVNNANAATPSYTYYYDASNKFHYTESELCRHLSGGNLSLDYQYAFAKDGYDIQVKEVVLNVTRPYLYSSGTLYSIYDSEDDVYDFKIDGQKELKEIDDDIEKVGSDGIKSLNKAGSTTAAAIKDELNDLLTKNCVDISKSITDFMNIDTQNYFLGTTNEMYNINQKIANELSSCIYNLDAMIAINPDTIPEATFAQANKETIDDLLDDCEVIENELQQNITNDSQSMSDLARVYNACSNFDSNVTSLNKEIKQYNDGLKDCYSTYFELQDKADATAKEYNEIYNEYSAVSSLYYSSGFYSIESQIYDQENIISNYTAKIQDAQTAINDLNTTWASIDWKQYYHERVVCYSELVQLWQKRLNDTKTELDEAIKSNSTAGN